MRGSLSENPAEFDERPSRAQLPGGAYLSAALIALALMALVLMVRPRGEEPPVRAALPTARPAIPASVPTPTLTPVPTAVPPEPTAAPSPTPTPIVAPTATSIVVYVAGEVRRPNVYTLPPGSRVKDAVARAGGFTRRADPVAINLARRLRDEMQITVPAKRRAAARPTPIQEPPTPTPRPAPSPTVTPEPDPAPTEAPSAPSDPESAAPEPSDGSSDSQPAGSAGLVNINTATQAELESLPGIGPSKAAAIIAYRQEHGPFARPEDLQDVSGIGPKTWEGLADKVTV